jgi:hypothetical protein
MRRKGPGDISYCNTICMQESCKRNLQYWKAPTRVYSVTSFDIECKDNFHNHCAYKYADSEEK